MLPYNDAEKAIEAAASITILTHINPDADTLGTGLDIYSLLVTDKSKKVEIVNTSETLPLYLDFLPYYQKIKHTMEYTDSLVICCDAGNIERLGFALSGREILNIDHHSSNTNYGTINCVLPSYASSSQVAYGLFARWMSIPSQAAICFYTALVSDTQFFTTSVVTGEVFEMARELIVLGVNPAEVAFHFTQRRPLRALRILEKALGSLCLKQDAKIATIVVQHSDILATGATIPDMEGIVEYAKSLVTVEIAICAMELESGIRISLRSKHVDVAQVALAFGGGGHQKAAGFMLTDCGLQESIDIIMKKIEILGVIHGSKT